MYVIISIQKDHKGVKEFGILPLSGFHQIIRGFEMKYVIKLWTAIIILIAIIFIRECKHAQRYQNWTLYESELQQQIADLESVCNYDFD